jgi:hypothetical protein
VKCAASFYSVNAEDTSLLMELVERALKKTPEELEIEEIKRHEQGGQQHQSWICGREEDV